MLHRALRLSSALLCKPLRPLPVASAHRCVASSLPGPLGRVACSRTMSASASASALPVGARFPPAVDPPPCPERVRAALCQQAVTGDKAADTDAMRAAVLAAGRAGAQLVVLPECWNCPYSNASFGAYAEPRDGPSAAALSAAARDAGVVLVGGSIPERDGGALFNTCLVYGPDGQLLGFHRKLHLFDVDIPGGITFRESETLTAGDAVTVVDTAVGRLGVGVCFDLRFGEAAALAAARGAHALVFPGAFNTVTGPLHWSLLLRARAVDNLLFVLACSPARGEDGYQAWGHSLAVAPFGEGAMLVEADEKPAIVYADLEMGQIAARRAAIPLLSARRGDVYTLVDRRRAGLDA